MVKCLKDPFTIGNTSLAAIVINMPETIEKSNLEVERLERKEQGTDTPNAQVFTEENEPELHIKTWLALAAMAVLQYVSLLALVGPPAVVSATRASCPSSQRHNFN